jgi:hypothetical protein
VAGKLFQAIRVELDMQACGVFFTVVILSLGEKMHG